MSCHESFKYPVLLPLSVKQQHIARSRELFYQSCRMPNKVLFAWESDIISPRFILAWIQIGSSWFVYFIIQICILYSAAPFNFLVYTVAEVSFKMVNRVDKFTFCSVCSFS